jgi:transketolase
MAEILASVMFHQMRFKVDDPNYPTNDRIILSKGHAVPAIYAAYRQLGVLDEKQLFTLRQVDSPLEGHPTPRWIYNEAATGSLGQGLAIAVGEAILAKRQKLDFNVFTILGDGECAEGSVWEAANLASYNKLNNLIAIIDVNAMGQTGCTAVRINCQQATGEGGVCTQEPRYTDCVDVTGD